MNEDHLKRLTPPPIAVASVVVMVCWSMGCNAGERSKKNVPASVAAPAPRGATSNPNAPVYSSEQMEALAALTTDQREALGVVEATREGNPLVHPFQQRMLFARVLLTAYSTAYVGDPSATASTRWQVPTDPVSIAKQTLVWPLRPDGSPWPLRIDGPAAPPPSLYAKRLGPTTFEWTLHAETWDPIPLQWKDGVDGQGNPFEASALASGLKDQTDDQYWMTLASGLSNTVAYHDYLHGSFPDSPSAACSSFRMAIVSEALDRLRAEYPQLEFYRRGDEAFGLLLAGGARTRWLIYYDFPEHGRYPHNKLLGMHSGDQPLIDQRLAEMTLWERVDDMTAPRIAEVAPAVGG